MSENIKIIALNGPKGVGKTTVARALEKHLAAYGETAILSYASPIKKMAQALGVLECYLVDPEYKEKPIPGLGVTSRVLMQTLGTEWGRQMISENIWLWAMDRAIEQEAYDYFNNLKDENVFIIIDDCRFDNEADHVWKRGGIVVNLEREGVGYTGEHSSERKLSYEPDCVVDCALIDLAVASILDVAAGQFLIPELSS